MGRGNGELSHREVLTKGSREACVSQGSYSVGQWLCFGLTPFAATRTSALSDLGPVLPLALHFPRLLHPCLIRTTVTNKTTRRFALLGYLKEEFSGQFCFRVTVQRIPIKSCVRTDEGNASTGDVTGQQALLLAAGPGAGRGDGVTGCYRERGLVALRSDPFALARDGPLLYSTKL